MNLKNKIRLSITTAFFLTLTILFSSFSFTKLKTTNEVSASSEIAATFKSSEVVNADTYKKYENDDWLITYGGGGNKSIGANNATNGNNLVLGSYLNVMGFNPSVKGDDKFYSAVISKKTISNVNKISLKIGNIAKGGPDTEVYLTCGDSLTGSFSLIQKIDKVPSTLTEYSFTALLGQKYYALVFYNTQWFRLDNVEANFYAVENVRSLEGLNITGSPLKDEYYVGETFNPEGLTIEAVYDEGDNVDVTDQCLFTPDPLLLNTTDILVTYTELETTKTYLIENIITVLNRTLLSLEIKAEPLTMTYLVGQSFEIDGLVIQANFDQGNPIIDYKDYDYSPKGAFTQAGTQTIKITSLSNENVFVNLLVQVNEVPLINELFISEYIEGSSNNKGLEIYNGTSMSVDLSNYQIRLFANGVKDATASLTLSGTLENESTYVIINGQSTNNSLKSKANLIEQQVTNFNGDDAIGLYKNNVLIDVIGTIGQDPGTEWTGNAANGSGSTLDKTLVRTKTTFGPNITFDWSEWNCYPLDTFDYLGSHEVVQNEQTPEYVEDAELYGEYFLLITSQGCLAQSYTLLEDEWTGLGVDYLDLSDEAKDYFASLTPNEEGSFAEHALARYLFIITKYPNLDNFMCDSNDNLLFVINQDAHIQIIDSSKLYISLFVLISISLVSGTYLVLRKKPKVN